MLNVSLDSSLNIVLYQPEIPQNTGNIGRTCVAVGAKLWMVCPLGFRLDEKRVRRAGLDYWQHLNLETVDDFALLEPQLPQARTFYVTKHAERCYFEVSYERGDFFVFGRESTGLPASLREANSDRCIRIPMAATARSLNLANSVAVIAYEALRQFSIAGK